MAFLLRFGRNIWGAARKCAGTMFNGVQEAADFTYKTFSAFRRYCVGDISNNEFYREVCKHGFDSAGGFLRASAACGILSKMFVANPVAGVAIGTLGNLIGRDIVAVIRGNLS